MASDSELNNIEKRGKYKKKKMESRPVYLQGINWSNKSTVAIKAEELCQLHCLIRIRCRICEDQELGD